MALVRTRKLACEAITISKAVRAAAWAPIAGAVPPLTHDDWLRAFALYQATPEYQQVNGPAGMTLAQFRQIYWWEFAHRLLGRAIGLVFALPLAWFAWKRAIPKGYGWKMIGLLVLGGLQGALGWYMVMSGLSERTDVSHLRLSSHLLFALVEPQDCSGRMLSDELSSAVIRPFGPSLSIFTFAFLQSPTTVLGEVIGIARLITSGEVEPQLRLMLRPFGEPPIGTISAPRSARILGPTL